MVPGLNKELQYFNITTSEDGRVNVGCFRVLFGFRVVGWMTGDCGNKIDWCAGDDWGNVERLYALAIACLEGQEEDGTPFRGLPFCSSVKPFYQDVDFTSTVLAMAGLRLDVVPLPKPPVELAMA